MWNFFNSFAASTKFERYRLQITAKTLDAPNETSLRSRSNIISDLMKTFCSQDQQTKAQIAYATILKKIFTSDSRNSWIYLLKNEIILDRVIQEGVFTQQISQAHFDPFEKYQQTDNKYAFFDSEKIIKSFWKLIQDKAQALKSKKHIFCYKRSLRQDYLNNLNAMDTLAQIQSIENFFTLTFELIETFTGKKLIQSQPLESKKIVKAHQQFNKSKLLQYLNLQMLHKLMLYYSCDMLCCNYFIGLLIKSQNVRIDEIKKFRKCVVKFKDFANLFINFVEENKHIKGFQDINYRQLNPYQKQQMLNLIDKVLDNANKKRDSIASIDYIGQYEMKVQKQPSGSYEQKLLIPRKKMMRKSTTLLSTQNQNAIEVQNNIRMESTPFSTWSNSYSDQFPQKQIMTVDLITLLKQQKQNDQNPQDIQLQDIQRQPPLIYYDLRDTNITVDYEVALRTEEEKSNSKKFHFRNIYSGLALHWNND